LRSALGARSLLVVFVDAAMFVRLALVSLIAGLALVLPVDAEALGAGAGGGALVIGAAAGALSFAIALWVVVWVRVVDDAAEVSDVLRG
jgi:hypothetical protein